MSIGSGYDYNHQAILEIQVVMEELHLHNQALEDNIVNLYH